jgi:hypothetical protein
VEFMQWLGLRGQRPGRPAGKDDGGGWCGRRDRRRACSCASLIGALPQLLILISKVRTRESEIFLLRPQPWSRTLADPALAESSANRQGCLVVVATGRGRLATATGPPLPACSCPVRIRAVLNPCRLVVIAAMPHIKWAENTAEARSDVLLGAHRRIVPQPQAPVPTPHPHTHSHPIPPFTVQRPRHKYQLLSLSLSLSL